MIRAAWRRTCLALALLFVLAPFSAAFVDLVDSGERDCGMECCRRSKVCCCRKGKAVHESRPGWRELPGCAGRCGHPPALPTVAAAGFTPTRAALALIQESASELPHSGVPRTIGQPAFALFGRPPPTSRA